MSTYCLPEIIDNQPYEVVTLPTSNPKLISFTHQNQVIMRVKIFILALLFSVTGIKSQVLNSSFELLNGDSSVKNWGDLILFSIPFDSLGHQLDSVIIDKGLYFTTTDAHTGQRAMEMRNAYYAVSGQKIAGRAKMTMADSIYGAFVSPCPIGINPTVFSFYYKFFPVNNDTAFAYLVVTDSMDNELGGAKISIHQLASSYQLATAPVSYTTAGVPAFMTIYFRTTTTITQAHYGTRFIVDDVSTLQTGITERAAAELVLAPMPVDDRLAIQITDGGLSNEATVQLYDMSARALSTVYVKTANGIEIATDNLPAGIYHLVLNNYNKVYTAKVVKQ